MTKTPLTKTSTEGAQMNTETSTIAPTLAENWQLYDLILQTKIHPASSIEHKLAYYAGAFACFSIAARSLEPTGDSNDLKTLLTEMNAFADRFLAWAQNPGQSPPP